MCGILYLNSTRKIDTALFNEALSLQKHRGPNATGTCENGNNLLGHNRLSIIDLSSNANQPMVHEHKKHTIIFNGEIYNHIILRKELEAIGYKFKTNSDTEVLLNSYIEWSDKCLHKLIGMFAFVILDQSEVTEKIFVARDRIGVKPLFYYKSDSDLIISSEIKSILKLKPNKSQINQNALISYLHYRQPILNDTFFKDIHSVPHGTFYLGGPNLFNPIKYWSSKFNKSERLTSIPAASKLIESTLKDSIKLRNISDVPVGAYLSGGVDSSLACALMSNETSQPLKTYTIGFAVEDHNEFKEANLVAKRYKTDHKEITVETDNYFRTLEELIHYKDAPLSVPNEVPLYLMSKELKKDITVVISGEGADELFAGYGRIFRSTDDYNRYNSNEENNQIFLSKYEKLYSGESRHNKVLHFISRYQYIKDHELRPFISPAVDFEEIERMLLEKFTNLFEDSESNDYLDQALYTFQNLHVQGLLARVDTTTMAASVEARVPFLDHRLIQIVNQFSNELKLPLNSPKEHIDNLTADEISETHDTPKFILKKMGEKYLPNEILYRKKVGFPVPLHKWNESYFIDKCKALFNDPENPIHYLFNKNALCDFADNSSKSGSHSESLKLWMLFNLFTFFIKYKEHFTSE